LTLPGGTLWFEGDVVNNLDTGYLQLMPPNRGLLPEEPNVISVSFSKVKDSIGLGIVGAKVRM
jgi:hypothetical protein